MPQKLIFFSAPAAPKNMRKTCFSPKLSRVECNSMWWCSPILPKTVLGNWGAEGIYGESYRQYAKRRLAICDAPQSVTRRRRFIFIFVCASQFPYGKLQFDRSKSKNFAAARQIVPPGAYGSWNGPFGPDPTPPQTWNAKVRSFWAWNAKSRPTPRPPRGCQGVGFSGPLRSRTLCLRHLCRLYGRPGGQPEVPPTTTGALAPVSGTESQ